MESITHMVAVYCYTISTGRRELMRLVEESLQDFVREAFALADTHTDHVYYVSAVIVAEVTV